MDGFGAHTASVLILYAHPLLGVGLQRLLEGEQELAVTALDTHDDAAAHDALGAHPDVVILERGAGIEPAEVLEAAPDTLLIDVGVDAGESFAIHREHLDDRGDGILEAIRRFRFRSGTAFTLLATLVVGSLPYR